ncbi:MAG: PLP-dependent aminotransferase family protein [Nitratireductor sp.]
MRESLFHVERLEMTTLQSQVREMLVTAMLSGQMPPGAPVPSTRKMAKLLKVSRNTVMLAYQALASDGYLEARERSGFYVSDDVREGIVSHLKSNNEDHVQAISDVDWASKFRNNPSHQSNIEKPENWHDFPYPFIYGQSDAALFPIAAWRDCARQSMSKKWLDAWTDDRFNIDDPMLIEQIHQRILPRRGIMANKDEILVTMGAQNALYLLADLIVKPSNVVAMEDPGYPDARNIFKLKTNNINSIKVDKDGLIVDEKLNGADIVFTTPSHQFPTNVTLSQERRKALLNWANDNDGIIIEDDYEFETNYLGQPTPALKATDKQGRVIYVGSLSKSLMPGLRLGFIVAPKELVQELRSLRRLMLRHPPGNNQRVVALFLALGHHDTLIGRLHRAYHARWNTMGKALQTHFPGWADTSSFGGTSWWLKGPAELDSKVLAARAAEDGILIEPGGVFFDDEEKHKNHFRLGFSSIPEERIETGIEQLAKIAKQILSENET